MLHAMTVFTRVSLRPFAVELDRAAGRLPEVTLDFPSDSLPRPIPNFFFVQGVIRHIFFFTFIDEIFLF